jgi:hypothetical protein
MSDDDDPKPLTTPPAPPPVAAPTDVGDMGYTELLRDPWVVTMKKLYDLEEGKKREAEEAAKLSQT